MRLWPSEEFGIDSFGFGCGTDWFIGWMTEFGLALMVRTINCYWGMYDKDFH